MKLMIVYLHWWKNKNETRFPYRKSGCAALDMAYVALEDMMDIFKII
jgi:hypothetical protein